jgi:hypothetical protein
MLQEDINIFHALRRHLRLQIAHGSFEDGTFNSSVGSGNSTLSTLTTPHVEVDSATDRSSGMKASPPSVNFGSRAVRFSARDLVSISRYCEELENILADY